MDGRSAAAGPRGGGHMGSLGGGWVPEGRLAPPSGRTRRLSSPAVPPQLRARPPCPCTCRAAARGWGGGKRGRGGREWVSLGRTEPRQEWAEMRHSGRVGGREWGSGPWRREALGVSGALWTLWLGTPSCSQGGRRGRGVLRLPEVGPCWALTWFSFRGVSVVLLDSFGKAPEARGAGGVCVWGKGLQGRWGWRCNV